MCLSPPTEKAGPRLHGNVLSSWKNTTVLSRSAAKASGSSGGNAAAALGVGACSGCRNTNLDHLSTKFPPILDNIMALMAIKKTCLWLESGLQTPVHEATYALFQSRFFLGNQGQDWYLAVKPH